MPREGDEIMRAQRENRKREKERQARAARGGQPIRATYPPIPKKPRMVYGQ